MDLKQYGFIWSERDEHGPVFGVFVHKLSVPQMAYLTKQYYTVWFDTKGRDYIGQVDEIPRLYTKQEFLDKYPHMEDYYAQKCAFGQTQLNRV